VDAGPDEGSDVAGAGSDADVGDGGGHGAGDAGTSSGEGSVDGGAADSGGSPDAGFVCSPSEPEPLPGPDSFTYLSNVVVDTLAGGPSEGTMDGTVDVATFSNPVSVIVEPAGTLIDCDFDSNRLRRVDMMGTVTTLTSWPGFLRPFGLGYGADGSLYVDTDYNPNGIKNGTSGTIWRVDPVSGNVTVVAANIGRPRGFAAVPDGRLMLADYQNARVRLLDPATGAVSDLAGSPACPGMAEGQGSKARFFLPYDIAPLRDGTFVVADYGNHRLRRIGLDGQVTAFAGDGGEGTVDGPRLAARFVTPKSVVTDQAGNVYVSDPGAYTIRRVGTDGSVLTVAGDGLGGFQDGPGPQAEFFGEEGLAISADGMTLFVADGNGGDPDPYDRIRRISLGP
jgi:sugar lactone lactonase YvrE